jgi:hypothetical protein
MPKNYGYGVKPAMASKSKKFGRSRRKKVAKKAMHKKTAVKTVMATARSY